MQRLVDLADRRKGFVPDGDADAAETWESSIRAALVERAYACVVGYRC